MTSIRIKGCKCGDIQKIVKNIERFHRTQSEEHIENIIKTEAEFKTRQIISNYDIKYCKTIIINHLKGNILDLMRKYKMKSIDLSNETKFYREIIQSYISEIIYTKIKNLYYYSKEDSNECSICLDKITDYRELHMTSCNHKFPIKCHLKWVKHNGKSCPNCRANL